MFDILYRLEPIYSNSEYSFINTIDYTRHCSLYTCRWYKNGSSAKVLYGCKSIYDIHGRSTTWSKYHMVEVYRISNQRYYYSWSKYFDSQVEAAKDKVNISKHCLVVHSYKVMTHNPNLGWLIWLIGTNILRLLWWIPLGFS